MFDWKEVRTSVLITFIGFIGGLIWTIAVKYINDVTFIAAWKIVSNTEIRFWICLLLIVLAIIVTYMLSRPNSNSIQRKRNQLRKINSIKDDSQNTLIKWDVHFGYNGKPFVGDIALYCTNDHSPIPLKFIDNRCPFQGCTNNERWASTTHIENGIQSMIDHNWDEINKL